MADDTKDKTPSQRIDAALLSEEIPSFYCNGFANTLSTGDITTVLEMNGKPVAILNMSYTIAKTLSQKLGVLIAKLESATGREMLTNDEIAAALTKSKKPTENN